MRHIRCIHPLFISLLWALSAPATVPPSAMAQEIVQPVRAKASGGLNLPGDITDAPFQFAPVYYSGLWRHGAEEVRLHRAEALEGLEAPPGFVLDDIEVADSGAQRRYAGVYRRGQGESQVLEDLSRSELLDKIGDFEDDGYCLVGLEAVSEGELTTYAAVWRSGCERSVLVTDMSEIELAEKLHELAGTHHLADLETEVIQGRLKTIGLWLAGPETQDVWSLVGLTWESFHQKMHDLTKLGFVLQHLDVQLRYPESVAPDSETGLRVGRSKNDAESHAWSAVSGVWRFVPEGLTPAEDWLGVDYTGGRLGWVDEQLTAGLIPEGQTEGEGSQSRAANRGIDPIVSQPLRPMYLSAIEMTSRQIWRNPCGNHAGPLHDSGTAGPP